MRWLVCALLACSRPPASGPALVSGPGSGSLTPEDVGLPATPEEESPVPITRSAPAGQLAPFYSRQECPPARRGCVLSREVTRDQVRTALTCPHGAGYSSTRSLRQLVVDAVEIARPDTDPRIRHAVLALRPALERCLAARADSATLEVAAVIGTSGRPIRVHLQQAPVESESCVRDTVHMLAVPALQDPVLVTARFELVVDDPQQFVVPLDCP